MRSTTTKQIPRQVMKRKIAVAPEDIMKIRLAVAWQGWHSVLLYRPLPNKRTRSIQKLNSRSVRWLRSIAAPSTNTTQSPSPPFIHRTGFVRATE
jgi:hypothetical protein